MEDPWVTVMSFSQPIEAHVARTKLESEGIECAVADEHIVRMDWFYSMAVGGVKVKVRERDLDRARELLNPAVSVAEPSLLVCPKCQSRAVDYNTPARRIALCFLFLGLPFPYLRRKLQCHTCGHV